MNAPVLTSALALGDAALPGLDDLPRIRHVPGELSFEGHRIALPAARLDVAAAITAGKLDEWIAVARWISDRLGPDRALIISHANPLRDLALLGSAQGLFSYGLTFAQALQRVFVGDYALIGSASLCIFADADIEEQFRRAYVPHYTGVLASDGPQAIARALEPVCATPVSLQPSGKSGSGKLKVLLIAYFSGPSRTVGVQRINYWHAQMEALSQGEVEITLATATPWPNPPQNVRIIPDWGPAVLIRPDGKPESWAVPFLDSEKLNAKSASTLSYYWRIALERHFEAADDQYDVVILSGNPFAVFDFATWAKRRWYARVILDYRDPFANNPRMAFTPQAREAVRYLEQGYNLQADLVTVVNDDCIAKVEALEDVPVKVIPNGFDERTLVQARTRWREADSSIHFVHAGTIFHDRSPTALIGALDPTRHRLHHIGNLAGIDPADQEAPQVELHGTLPYPEVLGLISQADCGIVFVSETGFETPTKLYDYLAYGLDILIVTHGPLYGGAVAEVLKGLEGIYWAQNTPEGLASFIADYTPAATRRDASYNDRFTRRGGTLELLEQIGRLTGHSFTQKKTGMEA
ncbi:Glycosyltransferase involved in cell wall bisynthesis [Rhodobacter sp. 24-YEA-8]|nr:Glycosyltransferase involved in cell wall bisynthesis [Rhodobacter sp. 24-YEA-8]